VKMRLEEAVEPHFHENSYGSRPRRSARQAVELCRKRCYGYRWVVDLDIRAYFDTIRHDLLLRAVDKHATTPWEKLYIRRWLRTEVVTPEGIRYSPICGTTQGATISPLLANLFLHYALDMWMKRKHPDIPFERYVDDVIVHCLSEKQARFIRDKIAQHLKTVGLELHPEKTKVVYCQKYRSETQYPEVKFSFLGFDFKPRKTALSPFGDRMTFTPAVGQRGKKRLAQVVRSLRIPRRTDLAVEDIAERLNPFLRGWIEYYRHFRRDELAHPLLAIDLKLTAWARRKFRLPTRKALALMERIARQQPQLFAHWSFRMTQRNFR
jgi:RNA-directed DNA polymerase